MPRWRRRGRISYRPSTEISRARPSESEIVGRQGPRELGGVMSYRRGAAEAVGTFVLVFGGVGTAVIAGKVVGPLGVAFAFGLSLLAMAYAIGPVSGCHINPAVTVGLLTARKIGMREAVEYWIGQCVGAILASAALYIVIKSRVGPYNTSVEG